MSAGTTKKRNLPTGKSSPSMDFKRKHFDYIKEDDIIEMEEVLEDYNMKRRHLQAQRMHKYPIKYTVKSGWFTDVDDFTMPKGKRKIRKSTEEKQPEALAEWYIDQEGRRTSIDFMFHTWLEWKETPTNAANLHRIKLAWETYYENEPMSQTLIHKPMGQITTIELRKWAENLMRKHHPVDRKKFSRMFSIINNCYEFATDEDINVVQTNLWQKARKKINPDLMVSNPTPTDESQVFTDDERRLMRQMVFEDLETYSDRPTSAGLQILFMLETGLRMGECCGLKWSDVRNGRLYVQRQARNDGVREWTKTTNGYRDIPLTDEAQRILEAVKQFNDQHGFKREWIFQSDNAKYDYRLSYNAANNKLRKLCIRMDSVIKSPHKLRKTCLSALIDNPNVSNRTVQRFAGHSDITTTLTYYSFDRSSKEEQAMAINEALKLD